jgi:hypothetical protein
MQTIVLHTYLIIIFESPNIFNILTFIFNILTFKSTIFLNPRIITSYSIELLVHWNSSLHDIKILFPLGSFRMHPTPTPSLDLDPSKNKFHMLVVTLGFTFGSKLALTSKLILSMGLVFTSRLVYTSKLSFGLPTILQ